MEKEKHLNEEEMVEDRKDGEVEEMQGDEKEERKTRRRWRKIKLRRRKRWRSISYY